MALGMRIKQTSRLLRGQLCRLEKKQWHIYTYTSKYTSKFVYLVRSIIYKYYILYILADSFHFMSSGKNPISLLMYFNSSKKSHLGQIDQIDHDLDHLVPHLPLQEVVQDLYSTDPTQETRPR